MDIAVLGCGRMGTALARALSRRHRLLLASPSGSRRAQQLCDSLDGSIAVSPAAAVRAADVVVLAVPFRAVAISLVDEVVVGIADKPLVDVTNPAFAEAPWRPGVASGALLIAGLAPRAKVVKAFNAVPAGLIDSPVLSSEPISVPVAANDEHAKATVMRLVAELGFDVVDAGGLDKSELLERLAVIVAELGRAHGVGHRVGFRLEYSRAAPGVEMARGAARAALSMPSRPA